MVKEDVIDDDEWKLLASMEECMPEAFGGMLDAFSTDWEHWDPWLASDEAYKLEGVPPSLGHGLRRLTSFQVMLILRGLAFEKCYFAVPSFIKRTIGDAFKPAQQALSLIHI